MIPKWVVKEVRPLENYKLLLLFESGEKKIYDCSPLLKYEIFEPLANKAFFDSVYTDGCTTVWNEDIDIDPITLYQDSIPANA